MNNLGSYGCRSAATQEELFLIRSGLWYHGCLSARWAVEESACPAVP